MKSYFFFSFLAIYDTEVNIFGCCAVSLTCIRSSQGSCEKCPANIFILSPPHSLITPLCVWPAASRGSHLLVCYIMLRESSKAWSNGSEAYSSDPEEEEEEEEEDMVFGETDQNGMAEEMMDLSDLPTALFACSVHDAVFDEDVHRVRCSTLTFWVKSLELCVCVLESPCWVCLQLSNRCMMSSSFCSCLKKSYQAHLVPVIYLQTNAGQ